MAKFYDHLPEKLQTFIHKQKMFFVATAGAEGRVNVSPKGMDSLHIVNENKVIWLNLTGSGNETAAHVFENKRMTLMYCSFERNPLILRLYGTAAVVHPRDERWAEHMAHFKDSPGVRQIFDMHVDLVQTSCGFGVPFYQFEGERDTLMLSHAKKGREKIEKYWEEKNQLSIDGKPTYILTEE